MNMFRNSAAIIAALPLMASAPVPRGQPRTLIVTNATGGALECHAVVGHWYGFDLGDVLPGARLTLAVLYDPASGMIAVENTRGRLMPLQSIYCGPGGDAWRERADVPMRQMLEQNKDAACHARASRIDCGG
jgi:hypothetical protein